MIWRCEALKDRTWTALPMVNWRSISLRYTCIHLVRWSDGRMMPWCLGQWRGVRGRERLIISCHFWNFIWVAERKSNQPKSLQNFIMCVQGKILSSDTHNLFNERKTFQTPLYIPEINFSQTRLKRDGSWGDTRQHYKFILIVHALWWFYCHKKL